MQLRIRTFITACLLLTATGVGFSAGAAELREGERLEGYTFHTFIEIPFESRERAEQWMQMNADLSEAELSERDGQTIIRIPKVYDNLLRMVGQTKVSGSERFENGVFIRYHLNAYSSEEEARRVPASEVYRGKGKYMEVIDRGVETHPEYKFVRRMEIRQDLVAGAQQKAQRQAIWLKTAVRNPGGGIKPIGLDDHWNVGNFYFGGRDIINFLVMSYGAPYKESGAGASVGNIKRRGPIRHALLYEIANRPKINIRRFDDQYVLVGSGAHMLDKYDGDATIVAWESGPETIVRIRFAPDVDIEPLVRAYLAWHPSTWPTADYKFERMDWLREEVEIAIELLAWFISDDLRQEVEGDLTTHLGELNKDNAKPVQTRERIFAYEMYAIERWFDTPVRLRHPTQEFPLDQAGYDEAFSELLEWWKANRDNLELREGAPFKSYHAVREIDNRPSPEQAALDAKLIVAVEKDQLEQAGRLIEQGASPNARKMNHRASGIFPRAIELAIERKNKQMISLLLKAGASANPLTPRDQPPLFWAVARGDRKMVEMLLEAGATVDPQYFEDHAGLMAQAASDGKLDVLELLLERGHDIDEMDKTGRTPLMHAATQGRLETVAFLIEQGADVNAKTPPEHGRVRAVISSAVGERPAIMKLLLESGAKPDAASLVGAVIADDLENLKLLVEAGGDIHARAPDIHGRMVTPLEFAEANKRERIVEYLRSLVSETADHKD